MSQRVIISTSPKVPSINDGESIPIRGIPDGHDGQNGHVQHIVSEKSLNIMILTILLQSLSFTIVMPSLLFYLEELGGTEHFLGYVVASYSLGQFVASPFFGWWSNRRPTAEALYISLAIGALGNAGYALSYLAPVTTVAPWCLIASRFIVGVGCGNVSVCRAYCSHGSNYNNRRSVMAKASAAQGIGFVLGPVLGTVLSYALPHALNLGIKITEYTSVGWLIVIINILNVVLIFFLFVEIPIEPPSMSKVRDTTKELFPILLCIVVFMIIIADFAVFETIVAIYTRHYYFWDTKDNGILLACAGLISIITFFAISLPIVKKLGDRQLLVIGLVITGVSLLLLAQWTAFERSVPMWQFITGSVLQSIGYPISSALIYAVFSKVCNPKSQGTKMGWLTAGGSLARMLGPIWASDIAWRFGGSSLLFMGTAGLVFGGLALTIIDSHLLRPHPDYLDAYAAAPAGH